MPFEPEKITFVPDTLMLEHFGCATPRTSIEPSTSSLFVQPSPVLSVGSVTLETEPAKLVALNNWKRSPAASAVGPTGGWTEQPDFVGLGGSVETDGGVAGISQQRVGRNRQQRERSVGADDHVAAEGVGFVDQRAA